MKKLKRALITCICLCFCLMSGTIFAACNQTEESNPYVKVSGLSTTYAIGEELDLSNAKVLYYENTTDETPDEYALTRDMVTGFYNETAGTKTLKVTYKIYETELDYKIMSAEELTQEFISLFNSARAEILSSTQLSAEEVEYEWDFTQNLYTASIDVGYYYVNGTTSYYNTRYDDGHEMWRIKEEDSFVAYQINNYMGDHYYTFETSDQTNSFASNHIDYLLCGLSDELTSSDLSDVDSITRRTEGNTVVYKLINSEDYMEFTFENGKLINTKDFYVTYHEEKGYITEKGYKNVSISYTVNAADIPTKPDAEWVETTEDA